MKKLIGYILYMVILILASFAYLELWLFERKARALLKKAREKNEMENMQ